MFSGDPVVIAVNFIGQELVNLDFINTENVTSSRMS